MTELLTYCVGDHLFSIEMPVEFRSRMELVSYAPFRIVDCQESGRLFTVSVVSEESCLPPVGDEIAAFKDENGLIELFAGLDGRMSVRLTSPSRTKCCQVCFTNDYTNAVAWIGGDAGERRYGFHTAIMMLYAFASSRHDTVLVHASAVEHDGLGYLFLGKSGTGKSTHSRLWIEHVERTELINDDNPVVRIIDDKVYVYGSPWSGKTPCYVNRKFPVAGIVRLCRAACNSVIPLVGIKAYAALLPSCSCMKWEHEMAEAIHGSVARIVDRVPTYRLECLPDRDAALLCERTVTDCK